MILIISHAQDLHMLQVAKKLQACNHAPFLLDYSRFPKFVSMSLNFGTKQTKALHDGEWGDLELKEIGVVWWRRPQPFGISEEITHPTYRQFAASEAYEVFAGFPGLLDARWVNVPASDDLAHRKVFQLRLAEKTGMDLPDTLVTNSPESALAFIKSRGIGNVIFKAFAGTPQSWRETRLVGEEELGKIEMVKYAPVIFQSYIKGTDIRVTVIGNHIFAAEIDISNGDYPVDFRMNYSNANIRPVSLPDFVENQIYNLMSTLGLVYGAIDFRKTPEGKYVFLEINPAGQWLFIEQQTSQPITETMANTLIALDQSQSSGKVLNQN